QGEPDHQQDHLTSLASLVEPRVERRRCVLSLEKRLVRARVGPFPSSAGVARGAAATDRASRLIPRQPSSLSVGLGVVHGGPIASGTSGAAHVVAALRHLGGGAPSANSMFWMSLRLQIFNTLIT